MKVPWRADGVVVRTPMLPLATLRDWTAAPDPRAFLAAVVAQPEVDEAIFLASPQLHGQIAAWRARPDAHAAVERALAKYVARMAARATPFGLFSGVSIGAIGRATEARLAPRAEYRRRTRLDNDYLFALAGALGRDPAVRAALVYRPSSALYRVAGVLRYAEARLEGGERRYRLVSAEPTPYLEATLARAAAGARLDDLAAALVADDAEVTPAEARAYVDELVDAQLLVPDLGIHVTGREPIDGVIDALPADLPARRALERARAELAALDARGTGNPAAAYRAIAGALDGLPAAADLARLFQVDLVKPAAIVVSSRVVAAVAQTLARLARVVRYGPEDASLAAFRAAFTARWEDREVPLAEVLDEESGIGFEAAHGPGSEGSPLLAGLAFPGQPGEGHVPWRRLDELLLARLARALAAGEREIAITDAELDGIALDRPARLPDAFAAAIRIAATPAQRAAGEATVLLQGAGGPSGAQLLGRFCHASPEIEALVRAHHAAEEALRPGAVFAEIVHLNEGRIGNILCRPVLRGHELVYLGLSGAPRERQLLLDDLVVAVRGERVVLRSRRLGREVVPRLTTAHNFRLRSLGVYRFLCAVASQGVELAPFRWGALDGAPFLPRVRIGDVVVARATWNLGRDDLAPLTTAARAGGGAGAAAIAALRARLGLPRFVVLAHGDHELPIDLDNPLLAGVLAGELAGRTGATLRELFPAPDELIVEGPEGAFSNEVLLTFTRTPEPAAEAPAGAAAPRPPAVPRARREFGPGSEWLYAKIYTGVTTADRVLRDAVAPVVREALAAGDADRWFFLRYHDPDPHVRVRLHGDPGRLVARVVPALDRALAPLIECGAARRLVLDTYARELERYGGDHAIELVEEVFWRDSEAVLGIVELLEGDAGADARWRLAVRGLASLLDALGLPAEARARIVTRGRDMIGLEVGANVGLWKQLGDRFTRERAALEHLFERDAARDAAHDLEPGLTLLAARDAALAGAIAELRARDAAGALAPALEGFAWSLLHMHANRLLHASQRAQELVLYDFLRRLYAARRARPGRPNPAGAP